MICFVVVCVFVDIWNGGVVELFVVFVGLVLILCGVEDWFVIEDLIDVLCFVIVEVVVIDGVGYWLYVEWLVEVVE